jgi:chromate transporter
MPAVSVKRLSAIFLRVSNLTFGGGDPTMAALYTELVVARRWLKPETYGLVYALARVTPGTNVLAFSAGVAWELAGWAAAFLAVAAAAVPATMIIVLLSAGYESIQGNRLAMAAVGGTLAAAVGMMVASACQLLAPHLKPRAWPRALVLAGAGMVLPFWLSPVQVLALAAVAGWFWHAPEQS